MFAALYFREKLLRLKTKSLYKVIHLFYFSFFSLFMNYITTRFGKFDKTLQFSSKIYDFSFWHSVKTTVFRRYNRITNRNSMNIIDYQYIIGKQYKF